MARRAVKSRVTRSHPSRLSQEENLSNANIPTSLQVKSRVPRSPPTTNSPYTRSRATTQHSPTPSMLGSLPVELIQIICQWMPKNDLAKFRLVCKAFSQIGAKPLVENLHLMILPKSFENLYNISRCPSLNKYVRGILYEATTLELLEEDEWKERLPTAENAPPIPEHPGSPLTSRGRRAYVRELTQWDQKYGPGSQYTERQLKDAWQAYREVLDATDEIEIYYGDFATFNDVFRYFPNLTNVEFNTSQHPSETMKAAFASTLIAPGPANDVDRELAAALSLRYLTPLLLALIYTGVELTHFKADAISWHAFHRPLDNTYHYNRSSQMRGPTVEFPWQIDPKLLAPALSNLRQLHLVFEPEMGPDDSVYAEQEVFGRVLKSATKLQNLRLEFNESYFSELFPPDQVFLHRLLGDIHWKDLTSLHLSSVRVTEDYLVELLTRHSSTLKHLKLDSMYLSHGQWASAFQRMREVLRLESVSFGDIFVNIDSETFGENFSEASVEYDGEDDIYLDMDRMLASDTMNPLSLGPLGWRLETYFLGQGFRCPLLTTQQKAKLRDERERARVVEVGCHSMKTTCWSTPSYDDGLKAC